MSYAKPLRPRRDPRDPDLLAGGGAGAGFAGAGTTTPRTGGGGGFGTVDGAAARAIHRPVYADHMDHPDHLEQHDDEQDGGVDWGRVGVFGAGIAIGALLGAGLAVLYAPQSGAVTRRAIRRKALDIREDAQDRWDELGDRLQLLRRRVGRKRRRAKRDLGRKFLRGRWAYEDSRERD